MTADINQPFVDRVCAEASEYGFYPVRVTYIFGNGDTSVEFYDRGYTAKVKAVYRNGAGQAMNWSATLVENNMRTKSGNSFKHALDGVCYWNKVECYEKVV